jgi:hypothetical protein
MKKLIFLLLIASRLAPQAFAAPNLSAEMNMDVRAATASAAKKDATESAVRIGAIQILSRYSDRAVVENLIMGADESVLQNLVAATSIEGERQSKTAYSARFSITLDRQAVEKWYESNNVPNFLAAADESRDRSIISIDIGGLADLAELKRIVREDATDYGFVLRSIFRNSATAYVLANKRRRLQNLLASNGWRVWSQDGIVRISK